MLDLYASNKHPDLSTFMYIYSSVYTKLKLNKFKK